MFEKSSHKFKKEKCQHSINAFRCIRDRAINTICLYINTLGRSIKCNLNILFRYKPFICSHVNLEYIFDHSLAFVFCLISIRIYLITIFKKLRFAPDKKANRFIGFVGLIMKKNMNNISQIIEEFYKEEEDTAALENQPQVGSILI